MRLSLTAGCIFLALALASQPGRAAESYDNCTGFIDSLPATISAQGNWCLRKDLATAISSGNAITVAANNATLDCNGFKLGGLAAGPGTAAIGVRAENRLNVTVRGCNIRGFLYGILTTGGGGARVEGNRLEGNHYVGIAVDGPGSRITGNYVADTGGSLVEPNTAYGIIAYMGTDVLDNDVSGVRVNLTERSVTAIYSLANSGAVIGGNRIRGLAATTGGQNRGVFDTGSTRTVIIDNVLQDDSGQPGVGITCSETGGVARDNTINGFGTSFVNCISSGNLFN